MTKEKEKITTIEVYEKNGNKLHSMKRKLKKKGIKDLVRSMLNAIKKFKLEEELK